MSAPDFSKEDFDNFLSEIIQELETLGLTKDEAEKRLPEWHREAYSRPYGWLLFHESPEHWAKGILFGHDYWRKKPNET